MLNQMDDGYDKFINRIKEKLDNNPELKDEIQENVARLSEIFETDVNLNLEFYPNVENYKEIFKEYDDEFLNEDNIELPDLTQVMTLKDLKLMLDDEEDDLQLCFDPIYVKNGINDINDMLITTIKDRIILIPTVKK